MKKVLSVICLLSVLAMATACGETAADTTTAAYTTAVQDAETESTEADTNSEVEEVADTKYVIEDGVTDKMIALSRLNEGNKVRLANVLKKAQNGEEITVAYIGGSITQGSSAGDDLCYARLVTNWLQDTFPSATVNYVRAGIGATGSYIGVHRADRDVLSYNPDLVFVEFLVNDTTENTQRNIDSYDSLLQKLWNADSKPALVTIAMTQEDGTSFVDYVLPIVQKYDIPMISYKNAIMDVIEKGYIKWSDISNDNIHPNVEGHAALTQLITAYLSDVLADIDSISGAESDLSEPYTENKYMNASLVAYGDERVTECEGFQGSENNFGNIPGFWRATANDGRFGENDKLTFTVEAKNIGILYGKIVGGGGTFTVTVDGEVKAVINENFANGWGNYVECQEVAAFDEVGTHVVEITPVSVESGEKQYVVISCLAIS